MSTQKIFKVTMIMDKGGMTAVLQAGMNRADAIQKAKSANPKWHATGQAEEIG